MNVVAKIGHNQPPEPTPFDLSKDTIEGLFEEAKGWLDGEPIASQEQADDLQKLLRMIQAAEKEADARRIAENEPFDAGKAEVQARYAPLIANTKSQKGMTVLAIETCKKALAPWLLKVDEENRRLAAIAKAEADEKQRIAREAMQHRQTLEDAERAEALVKQAKDAEAAARAADRTKAQAKGEGRAVGLRDYYTPEISDATAFARHVWLTHRPDMERFLQTMAERLVAGGARTLPGVTVHHERRAQ